MAWHGLAFLEGLYRRTAKPSRPPQILTPPTIEFVGEQAGPVEDEIKDRFCDVFDQNPDVRSAYLARLSYGSQPGYSVALCICSTKGVDERLQKHLGEVFAARFKSSEYLDILFLSEEQEQQVRKVCSPFYELMN